MPRSSSGPHQVRGHHRLAVTWLERVEGAEGRGDKRSKKEHANSRLLDPDQVAEGISSRRLTGWLKGKLRAVDQRSSEDSASAFPWHKRCSLVAHP